VKNLVSDVDSKVKQFQDKFSDLRSALQQQADIYTEITVLRVLDVVGEIGEFSDLVDLWPFPRLIRFATSRGS
jgi:hypothetical protein